MTGLFPATPGFSGPNRPMRLECDIYDLEIDGTLPPGLRGSWYRLGPDPQYPPYRGDDIFINGDGVISMFRFANGHVDFKMRYIRTERYTAEHEARRSLFGAYRSRFTNHPSIGPRTGGTANTTPIWHGGKLMALKEDSLPVEVDPDSLATRGEIDYGGALRTETVTAHPKIDPVSGELLFYGYEASGDASLDISFCVADASGRLTREEWFKAPYPAMVHDFAVTQRHVIFPIFPTTTDLDRLKAGGPHWVWDGSKDTFIGIMPRDGTVKDMRWFKRPACFSYHVLNAFSDRDKVYLDLCVAQINPFPFFPDISGTPYDPKKGRSYLTRWIFDLGKPSDGFEEQRLYDLSAEMPRIDDRVATNHHRYGYLGIFDPSTPTTHRAGPVGAAFNHVGRLDIASGTMSRYYVGEPYSVQEPQFIPSKEGEGEGYVIAITNHHDDNLSDLVVLDAGDVEAGPIATVKMPIRLRNAFHGNWVPTAKS